MVHSKIPVIEFGRDYYHLQDEMQNWCMRHFGNGEWTSGPVKTWMGMHFINWVIWCQFGTTFFQFRQESDAVLFALKWK